MPHFQVVARGMDFPQIKIVVNYGLPNELSDYVHRIGRTGRMGQEGRAVTLVSTRNIESGVNGRSVARGICCLIGDTSHLPQKFVLAANQPGNSGGDMYPSRFSSSRPPRRMKNGKSPVYYY